MVDDSRFKREKSISRLVVDVAALIFDLAACCVVGTLMVLRAFVKEIQGERKSIRGKLALVNWLFQCEEN